MRFQLKRKLSETDTKWFTDLRKRYQGWEFFREEDGTMHMVPPSEYNPIPLFKRNRPLPTEGRILNEI